MVGNFICRLDDFLDMLGIVEMVRMNDHYYASVSKDCTKCRKLGAEHFHRLRTIFSCTSKTKMSLNTFQDMVSKFVDFVEEKRETDNEWHCTIRGKFDGVHSVFWTDTTGR